MAPLVILIGPPAAGKTTIGKKLAKLMAVEFFDSDKEIEKQESKLITDIFTEQGEVGFRKIEAQVVTNLLATVDGVLSFGAGTILNDSIRKMIRDIPVVYLEISLQEGIKRTAMNDKRPLLKDNGEQKYQQLLQQRRRYYESLAKIHIQVRNRPSLVVAKQIARSLGFRDLV